MDPQSEYTPPQEVTQPEVTQTNQPEVVKTPENPFHLEAIKAAANGLFDLAREFCAQGGMTAEDTNKLLQESYKVAAANQAGHATDLRQEANAVDIQDMRYFFDALRSGQPMEYRQLEKFRDYIEAQIKFDRSLSRQAELRAETLAKLSGLTR